MSDIINLLPDAIANQIAAGEVVQRPASVVKEMLENSVDAGAKNIQLIIQDAGKVLIQVIDDGIGMSETDARMCFERHATSKIQESDDLFKIKTLGFRGEALASIAAVARVELKTKTASAELGTFIHIEASDVKTQEPTSQNQGTSIAVKNLFYNVPARRNFLKSNPVEMRHIIDEFQRVSLANSNVSFALTQNDKEVYNLPAGKLSQRIVSLFGKNYKEQLVACSEETNWLKITGYIGKPENAKKTRGEQFFFVNNRFIKSSYLNHAVNGAYEGLLKEGQFPFYALFIEMDPIHTDINVHPTKTEVKFDDERSVYGIVKAAVKQALGTHNVTPSLDFGTDTNFENLAVPMHDFKTTPTKSEKSYGGFKSIEDSGKSVRWDQLYENAFTEGSLSPEEIRKEEIAGAPDAIKESESLTFESDANKISSDKTGLFAEEIGGAPSLIHEKYILKQVKSGLMVIDAHLAHERILFEKYYSENQASSSQQSLFPVTLDLNPADFSMVQELSSEIKALGFDFEEFGSNNIIIKGIPGDVHHVGEKELFEGLLDQFKMNQAQLSISAKENMARSMSKRVASRTKIVNDSIELSTLIDRLFACDQPNYTASGNPTFIILGLEKIEGFFNKN